MAESKNLHLNDLEEIEEHKKFFPQTEEHPEIPKSELSTLNTNNPKEKKILVSDRFTLSQGQLVPDYPISVASQSLLPLSQFNDYSLFSFFQGDLDEKPKTSTSSNLNLSDFISDPDGPIAIHEHKLDTNKEHKNEKQSSGYMPPLLTELLQELAAELKVEKPKPETLNASFTLLYQHCTRLSIEGWQQFLPLVHAYMQQCLPERNTLYGYYQQKTHSEILQQAQCLLWQYEQIGVYAQQSLNHLVVHEFYRQGAIHLVQKGCHYPEQWLGEPQLLGITITKPVEKIAFDEAKAQRRCQNNPKLKNYYEEFVRHLAACLCAAIIISSERVDPSQGFTQTITAALIEKLIPDILHLTPLAGGKISAVAKIIQTVSDFAFKLRAQRDARRVCAWSLTAYESGRLARSLGLRLALLREPTLVSTLAPSEISTQSSGIDKLKEIKEYAITQVEAFTDQARVSLQELKESKNFDSAGALALKDSDMMLDLLQQHTPNTQHWGGSDDWLNANAGFLADQFQKQLNQKTVFNSFFSIPQSTVSIESSCQLTVPSTSFPSARFYQGSYQPLTETIWLQHKQTADARMWRKEHEQQWNLLDKTNLDELLKFQEQILEDLQLSLGWSDKERPEILVHYVRPLWAQDLGIKVLTQAIQSAAHQSWSFWEPRHQQLQRALERLRSQDSELAEIVGRCYFRALAEWQLQVAAASERQAQELEKLTLEQKLWENRAETWKNDFHAKVKELGIDLSAPTPGVPPLTEEQRTIYANPEQFRQLAIAIWGSGQDFSILEPHSHYWESNWKSARNQNRPEANPMHLALSCAYREAQHAVEDAAAGKHHVLHARRESLKQQLMQSKTTAEALTKILQAQRVTEHKFRGHVQPTILSQLPSVVRVPDQKSSSLKKSFQERVTEFWQRAAQEASELERQLGNPPCGFSVLAWPVDGPQILQGIWRCGFFLTEPAKVDHLYWRRYYWFLQERLKTLTQLLVLPMQWAELTQAQEYQVDSLDVIPYRHMACCLRVSETEAQQAQNLWPSYQERSQARLAEATLPEHKMPLSRALAQQDMKATLTPVPAAMKQTVVKHPVCDPMATLLRPLQLWLRDAASFYGLAPETPENLLNALQTQELLHPDFITDLRAAYTWALAHSEALQDAWIHEEPPVGLNLGQAILLADNEAVPEQYHSAFYLSARHYRQHCRYTLEVLRQTYRATYARWCHQEAIPKAFNPVAFQAKYLLEQAAKSELTDRQAFRVLDSVIEAISHHPSLRKSADWQLSNFLQLSKARQLYYVEHLAPYLTYEEQDAPEGLMQQLLNVPELSGRRLRWVKEQREWQERLLPMLWAEDKTTTTTGLPPTQSSEASTSSTNIEHDTSIQPPIREEKDQVTPNEIKATVPPIQMSVVRQIQSNGELIWQVQTHLLKPEVAKKLFDSTGQWLPKDPKVPGNHRVFPIKIDNQRFWIKAYPEQPAIEWIVHQLDRRLGVFGTPRFEVVKFHHGGQTSCALLSEHVMGSTLKKVTQKKPKRLAKLDFISFARTLLRVLLINPEDDKDDDYLLEIQPNGQLHLKRIDNDRAFFEPFTAEGNYFFSKATLQVKSVVYCLEQMRQNWPCEPRMQSLLEEWRRIQPLTLMQDLLDQATKQQLAWKELFSQTEVEDHFKLPDPDKCLAVMFFPPGVTKEVINRLTLMQNSLRVAAQKLAEAKTPHISSEPKKPSFYPLNGLTLLYDTQPKLGRYYAKSHGEHVSSQGEEPKQSAEITCDHSQVDHRFSQAVGPWYKKNTQGEMTTNISSFKAFQVSLRLQKPLKIEQLSNMWLGQEFSPQQELSGLKEWRMTRLRHLEQRMLAPKSTVLAESKILPQNASLTSQNEEKLWQNHHAHAAEEFRALPQPQREKIWNNFYLKLRRQQLNDPQQLIILHAMIGAGWRELDLSVFNPELITDEKVTALLRGTQTALPVIPLLKLNLNGCYCLSENILDIIQRYSYETLERLYCNRLLWQNIALENWDRLLYFEGIGTKVSQFVMNRVPKLKQLNLSKTTLVTLSGTAPELAYVNVDGCHQLRHIGKPGVITGQPLNAPQLKVLNIAKCVNLEYLSLPKTLFYEAIISQLPEYPKLQAIELQIDQGFISIPSYAIPPLIAQSKTLDCDGAGLSSSQIIKLTAYLAHDQFFNHVDLSNNRLIWDLPGWEQEALLALGKALASNKTITHLNISRHVVNIGDRWRGMEEIPLRTCQLFCDMIEHSSLISLDMWGVWVHPYAIKRISAAARANPTFQELRHHYIHHVVSVWNKRGAKKQWVKKDDCIQKVQQLTEAKTPITGKLENFSSAMPGEAELLQQVSSSNSLFESPVVFFSTPDSKQTSAMGVHKTVTPTFIRCQNQLIKECEQGNLAGVMKWIAKGAQVNESNAEGKKPLYSAVYGLNFRIVQYLIQQHKKGMESISWKGCEGHNKKHYGKTFLMEKRIVETNEDWCHLMETTQESEFLDGYLLSKYPNTHKWQFARLDVACYQHEKVDGGVAKPLTQDMMVWWIKTAEGLEVLKEQIIRELQQQECSSHSKSTMTSTSWL